MAALTGAPVSMGRAGLPTGGRCRATGPGGRGRTGAPAPPAAPRAWRSGARGGWARGSRAVARGRALHVGDPVWWLRGGWRRGWARVAAGGGAAGRACRAGGARVARGCARVRAAVGGVARGRSRATGRALHVGEPVWWLRGGWRRGAAGRAWRRVAWRAAGRARQGARCAGVRAPGPERSEVPSGGGQHKRD